MTLSNMERHMTEFRKGETVRLTDDAVYYTGKQMSSHVKAHAWLVSSVSGSRVVLGRSADGCFEINAPVDAKYLIKET